MSLKGPVLALAISGISAGADSIEDLQVIQSGRSKKWFGADKDEHLSRAARALPGGQCSAVDPSATPTGQLQDLGSGRHGGVAGRRHG